MLQEQQLNWTLIHAIKNQTATPEQLAQWQALTTQQPEYAALIPWLHQVQQNQQHTTSPFYAKDAWQHFQSKLPVQPAPMQQPARRIFSLWQKAGAAAAAILIISLCAWLFLIPTHTHTKAAASFITYTVPNGQHKRITLPDGTQVWVNAGSSVKVPADWSADSVRQLWLEGEAFFEVQPNPSRPFMVHSPQTTIRVLGTSFNIEAYRQSPVAVTVATGKVQCSGKAGQPVILTQNQRSVWIPEKSMFEVSHTDATFYSIWREGVLQFRDEPLLKVIATLERRFNVQIKVAGNVSAEQYCTARFAAREPLANILESLRHIYKLHITHQHNSIIIQSR